ncbi:MAG: hypothetical protein LPK85_02825 [Gammaproteobacteria bacterium]|nr:hypothetical protein [Gammaproteobacteria bacterium]
MQYSSWFSFKGGAHVVALCLSLGMAGCASDSVSQAPSAVGGGDESRMRDVVVLDAALSAQLTDAAPHADVALPTSPWGDNVIVRAGDTYQAASGRQCRGLAITREGRAFSALACDTGRGRWSLVRPVTRLYP